MFVCFEAPALPLSERIVKSRSQHCEPTRSFQTYRNWQDSSMQKAVAAVEQGESIRKAVDKFNVPQSTSGKKPYLSAREEELLQKCPRIGHPHSCSQVLSPVQEMVDSKGLQCKSLWQQFYQRHPQSDLRSSIGLCRARATDEDPINKYYNFLEETFTSNKRTNAANQIYNFDETGMLLNPKPSKPLKVDSRGA